MSNWQNSSSMNITDSAAQLPVASIFCTRFEDENFFTANYVSTVISIILNALSSPVFIVMNLLVIVVVKTRRRLQNMYNILLACLASNDLLVGAVTQPGLIAGEIYAITGGSVDTYCHWFVNQMYPVVFFPILLSLCHLVIISFERFIALKYPFRYHEIVTKPRLTIAVLFSWVLVVLYVLSRILTNSTFPRSVAAFVILFSILVIAYCHFSVYLVTRRHEKKIAAEQISREAAEKFLKEKKAWKTTSIIIGFVILSFLPGVLLDFWRLSGFALGARLVFQPLIYYILLINSLANPIVYCWRCKDIRKAIIALIRRQNVNDDNF